MTKKKEIKAWAVLCSKNYGIRTYTNKENAEAHSEYLNEEYSPKCCKHKVVRACIIIKE